MFVNIISDELASNDLKAFELMKHLNYYVSDIVDKNKFTEIQGENVIKSSSYNIKKIIKNLFGNTKSLQIGRKKMVKNIIVDYQKLNTDNPLLDMKVYYVQNVIDNDLSIFRAYVNAYYWIKHKYNEIENKNLGYYSILQNDLANYFRSIVVDWTSNNKNKNIIIDNLLNYINIDKKKGLDKTISELIIFIAKNNKTRTNCILELFVLNIVNKIPIIIYDNNNEIKYIFDSKIKYNNVTDSSLPSNYDEFIKNKKNMINLRFIYINDKNIPTHIEVLYFK
jgi:hypothetical protein